MATPFLDALELPEISDPGAAAASCVRLYIKSDGFLYAEDSTGTVRRVSDLPSTSLTAGTVNSGTTEKSYGRLALAAGAMVAGSTFEFEGFGVVAVGSHNFTLRIRIGTTTLTGTVAGSYIYAGASLSATSIWIRGSLTIRTSGSSGTAIANIVVGFNLQSADTEVITTTVAANTTTALGVEFTGQAATSGDIMTFENLVIRQVV